MSNIITYKGKDNPKKTRIVIVDDNVVFRDVLSGYILQEEQYDIVGVAANGRDGLSVIDETRPDLVILDLLMPIMDGRETYIQVKKIKDYKPIVVMYSAMQSDLIVQDMLSLGIAYYFMKPFELDLFIHRLNEILKLPSEKPILINLPSKRRDLYINETTIILKSLGIPPHLSGYHFLRDAIVIAVEDFNKISTITISIYKPIAYQNNSTVARVERSMRHAIEAAWNRCRVDTIEKFFGNTVDLKKDKPANREFIAQVADRVILNINNK